jgi:hypothetical protein
MIDKFNVIRLFKFKCRSQWPSGLRCGFADAHLLGLCVRISLGKWMFFFVSVVCCQAEVRLIPRPEGSCRVWCVQWLCSRSLVKGGHEPWLVSDRHWRKNKFTFLFCYCTAVIEEQFRLLRRPEFNSHAMTCGICGLLSWHWNRIVFEYFSFSGSLLPPKIPFSSPAIRVISS